jgi:uncharacterized protein (DUF58 family)
MQEYEERLPTIFLIPLMQFFVGLFLFIALLNRQWGLTVLTLLVLVTVKGAKIWSKSSLAGIKCHSVVDKMKAFPGETITLNARVENSKFLPVWVKMKVPVHGSLHSSGNDISLTKESGLLWYQRVSLQWELIAQRRGWHRIGPPHLMAGDLLGFFPQKREEPESLHVIVYPRLVPLKTFSIPRRELFGSPGAKSPVHDPIYLIGTREYQHWQPARYIHWKASARHNRLEQKVCEPTTQVKVLLVVEVDQFAGSNMEDKFERTLEVVASLAVRLDRQGCTLGFATNGLISGGNLSVLPIARTPQQLSDILEVLARLQMESKGDLVNLLKHGLELPRDLSCVYFSYEKNDTAIATTEFFAQCKIPMISIVCQRPSPPGENDSEIGGETYSLDEIYGQ